MVTSKDYFIRRENKTDERDPGNLHYDLPVTLKSGENKRQAT
jgi:hypothetical protein